MGSREISDRTLTRKYAKKLTSKAIISKYIFLTKKEIKELRDLIDQMENKYRDPESKNKIKHLKADAQKQI